jgi:hypothetical protein
MPPNQGAVVACVLVADCACQRHWRQSASGEPTNFAANVSISSFKSSPKLLSKPAHVCFLRWLA